MSQKLTPLKKDVSFVQQNDEKPSQTRGKSVAVVDRQEMTAMVMMRLDGLVARFVALQA
jgi:hypothetical protein